MRTIIALLLLASAAHADSNSLSLALPSAPGSYQSDSFRAGDLDCSNAIGSATKLEFGVTGLISEGSGFGEPKDVGVYGRIVIPIGKIAKERINCNKLFELELQKKRLELLQLEEEVKALRNLQFEN